LMVRSQWEPFAEAVKGLGSPVRRLVLTHAHVDHVGGSRAFPLAAVYSSEATSALLDQPLMTEAYKALMPDFADELDELAEIGTRKVTHEVQSPARLTERIEAIPANGHTAGDLLVLVEDADVLFAGDLCFFGVTPMAFQGDPATWADVLEAIGDLAAVVVPGHGPVGGAGEVADLQAYLRACVQTAASGGTALPPGPWDAWSERRRDPVNLERVTMLAAGADWTAIPPSMLRALGMSPG
ncbi:MAG: MBL fold metallo-hydrolase, partial [Acidimicrobiia bacterium]